MSSQRNGFSKLTYLACPYTHEDPVVREMRFTAANHAAGWLMKRGHIVFSPISHTHPIAVQHELPGGWEYWEAFDRAYLEVSQKLVVLCIDGWFDSVGVTAEIKIAEELGIGVFYNDAEYFGIDGTVLE